MARHLLVSAAIALPALVLAVMLHGPMQTVERQFTSLKYDLRGDRRADTNVVLIYIDNEAIKSLGWPVRRNFYALMVKALADLQTRAVGIEVQFEDENTEYPEYDDLLAGVVASAKNVVLTSYFRSIEVSGEISGDSSGGRSRGAGMMAQPRFEFPRVSEVVQEGSDLHLPFARLLKGAAGIGHVNLAGGADVPLFIAAKAEIVPAFAAEVFRVSIGVDRTAVRYEGNAASFGEAGPGRLMRTSTGGTVMLNFPGSVASFTVYPFLEVLKSYDALRKDQAPSIPVQNLRGKIALIGVIAPGRSAFVDTPVDPLLPSLVLQGTFLDNALGSGFMTGPGPWSVYCLVMVLGMACAASVLLCSPPRDKIVPLGLIAAFEALALVLFLWAAYLLPVVPFLFAGALTSVVALVYKHRFVRRQVDSLQADRNAIASRLADREAKLAVLERELLDFETAKSADRTAELLEEIRRYKAEIHALTSRADDMEVYPLEVQLSGAADTFEGMVFDRSGPMKPVVDFIGKIAASDAPVLILGESGTGKELVARAIHRRSARAGKSFIAVNCGALAETLLESELFGHEKGAFTGAMKEKPGRFELADGGTIFLDEIGEVSESFQVKLLRVLQEGEIERVGGTATMRVNVRVLAATNKDLKEQRDRKKFREDLYYRLNVLTVELPPLRERQEDIPLLIDHFLRREDPGMKVSRNVMEALQNYPWRGNIREMESAIKRAVLLAKADGRPMVNMGDITEEISAALRGAVAIEDQILESLREKGFSRSSISDTAAELGGMNRGTVAEYLRGECLKAFAEQGFDVEKGLRYVSRTPDAGVNDRVRKKLMEYLTNIAEAVDKSQPWEVSSMAVKPKTKNLPQRYHAYLEKAAEAYFRGLWKPAP